MSELAARRTSESTALTGRPVTSEPTAPARAPVGRRPGRWYRAVVPFLVLALVAGVTWFARHLEEPDLGDPTTLAPHGTGPDGSSRLAELLTARGVEVEYVTDVPAAEAALAGSGDSVLFLPRLTPDGVALVRSSSRVPVVLVAPDQRELAIAGLPVEAQRARWAALATDPGCAVPAAEAAGLATAVRHRYVVADPAGVCYQGGLVRTSNGRQMVMVVGATDPFRNRRIDEYGNSRLATELLAGYDRVIWAGPLPPPPPPPPPPPGQPAPPPEQVERSEQERGDRDRTPSNAFAGLVYGYPPAVLAGMALLALLALLLALARARRLGPPVGEPLPVLVPAAETVAGSGRLYRYARGRGAALTAMRAAALRRVIRAVDLPPAPPPEPATVVAAVARATGLPPDHVHRTLYGPAPETDADLTRAVAALDALVAAVTRDRKESR